MTIQDRLRDQSVPFSLDDCLAAADRIDALEAALRKINEWTTSSEPSHLHRLNMIGGIAHSALEASS